MMNHWFFGAALAFLAGTAISYINYRISLLVLRKKPDAVAASSVARQFLNVAYFAAVYFLTPYTPWGLLSTLVGAAIGITIPMFWFTYLLLRASGNRPAGTQKEPESTTKGDD